MHLQKITGTIPSSSNPDLKSDHKKSLKLFSFNNKKKFQGTQSDLLPTLKTTAIAADAMRSRENLVDTPGHSPPLTNRIQTGYFQWLEMLHAFNGYIEEEKIERPSGWRKKMSQELEIHHAMTCQVMDKEVKTLLEERTAQAFNGQMPASGWAANLAFNLRETLLTESCLKESLIRSLFFIGATFISLSKDTGKKDRRQIKHVKRVKGWIDKCEGASSFSLPLLQKEAGELWNRKDFKFIRLAFDHRLLSCWDTWTGKDSIMRIQRIVEDIIGLYGSAQPLCTYRWQWKEGEYIQQKKERALVAERGSQCTTASDIHNGSNISDLPYERTKRSLVCDGKFLFKSFILKDCEDIPLLHVQERANGDNSKRWSVLVDEKGEMLVPLTPVDEKGNSLFIGQNEELSLEKGLEKLLLVEGALKKMMSKEQLDDLKREGELLGKPYPITLEKMQECLNALERRYSSAVERYFFFLLFQKLSQVIDRLGEVSSDSYISEEWTREKQNKKEKWMKQLIDLLFDPYGSLITAQERLIRTSFDPLLQLLSHDFFGYIHMFLTWQLPHCFNSFVNMKRVPGDVSYCIRVQKKENEQEQNNRSDNREIIVEQTVVYAKFAKENPFKENRYDLILGVPLDATISPLQRKPVFMQRVSVAEYFNGQSGSCPLPIYEGQQHSGEMERLSLTWKAICPKISQEFSADIDVKPIAHWPKDKQLAYLRSIRIACLLERELEQLQKTEKKLTLHALLPHSLEKRTSLYQKSLCYQWLMAILDCDQSKQGTQILLEGNQSKEKLAVKPKLGKKKIRLKSIALGSATGRNRQKVEVSQGKESSQSSECTTKDNSLIPEEDGGRTVRNGPQIANFLYPFNPYFTFQELFKKALEAQSDLYGVMDLEFL